MLLSCHVPHSEWIDTLYLPKYQRNPCSKQVRYLKFKRLQRDSNQQQFGHTGLMIELCCKFLSLKCFDYVVIVSRANFRMNPNCTCMNVKELLTRNRRDIWSSSDCNGTPTYNHLGSKKHSNIWPNWPNYWTLLRVHICTIYLIACCYHLRYEFESESTLYICLNVKEDLD